MLFFVIVIWLKIQVFGIGATASEVTSITMMTAVEDTKEITLLFFFYYVFFLFII